MAVHDLYRALSADMAARLERGDVPWAPEASGRPVRYTGHAYGGVSVLAQWSAMRDRGYDSPVWLSRPAIESLGGRLAAGERPVTAWYTGMRPVWAPSRATGDTTVRVERSWRPYAVWNAGVVEGLDGGFSHAGAAAGPREDRGPDERLASLAAEAGFDPEVEYRWPGLNPDEGLCRSLVRWTGLPGRLNRPGGPGMRTSDDGSGLRENLTVDIGAAFLAADLRFPGAISGPPRALVEDWCRLLRSDDTALLRCAREATRAVDYLHARAPGHRVALPAARVWPVARQGDPRRAGTIADGGGRAGRLSTREEFRQAGKPETATRNWVEADDWYLAGTPVEYRNHGPHDEFPGPWQDYGDQARQVPRIERGRSETARPGEAARDARQFVAAAEACRKAGDAAQTARLLDASRRIDIDVPDVATAIRAAAFIHGAGDVSAADWMAGFRRDAEILLRGERAEQHDLVPQIRMTGMRM